MQARQPYAAVSRANSEVCALTCHERIDCKRVSSFITDATDTIQSHYRIENCTKQEMPPEGNLSIPSALPGGGPRPRRTTRRGGKPPEPQISIIDMRWIPISMARTRLGRNQWAVSYTHLRAHETRHDLVCRLLL